MGGFIKMVFASLFALLLFLVGGILLLGLIAAGGKKTTIPAARHAPPHAAGVAARLPGRERGAVRRPRDHAPRPAHEPAQGRRGQAHRARRAADGHHRRGLGQDDGAARGDREGARRGQAGVRLLRVAHLPELLPRRGLRLDLGRARRVHHLRRRQRRAPVPQGPVGQARHPDARPQDRGLQGRGRDRHPHRHVARGARERAVDPRRDDGHGARRRRSPTARRTPRGSTPAWPRSPRARTRRWTRA